MVDTDKKVEKNSDGTRKKIVLIVEDDENAAKYIQTCLVMGNYDSKICYTGSDALQLLKQEHFDLLLLDLMLPDANGFEIQEEIKNLKLPIIFLTAVQDVADKVRALRAGAEDYIVKPFEVMELLARVEVVLRRYHTEEQTELSYGAITIETEKHIVRYDGHIVPLSPKEFEVLCFFIRHQDVVISRDRLLAELWDVNFQGESRTVDIHVQQVRRKLFLKDELLTIPKYGYRLKRG